MLVEWSWLRAVRLGVLWHSLMEPHLCGGCIGDVDGEGIVSSLRVTLLHTLGAGGEGGRESRGGVISSDRPSPSRLGSNMDNVFPSVKKKRKRVQV